jgi:hypothetical protein
MANLGKITVNIVVATKEFIRQMKEVGESLKRFSVNIHRIMTTASKAINLLLLPLKKLTKGFLILKASMYAVGLTSLKAAADFEKLHVRLITVLQSAEEANKVFKEIQEFSVITPFHIEELVDVRTRLEAIGITGHEALVRVATGAAATNTSVSQLADTLMSMNLRPLRRRLAGVLEEFQRRVPEDFRQSAKSFKDAQLLLLDLIAEKWPGAIERASQTFWGLTSTLQDNIRVLRAEFGKQFLGPSKLFLKDLIEGAQKFRAIAAEAGKNVAENLLIARANILAAFTVAFEISKKIAKTLSGEGGLGKVIVEAFNLGSKLFANAFATAIKVSIPLWKTIGAIIGEGFLNVFMRSNLPFAQTARTSAIRRNIAGRSDLTQLAASLGIPTERLRSQDEITQQLMSQSLADLQVLAQETGTFKFRALEGARGVSQVKPKDVLARDIAKRMHEFPEMFRSQQFLTGGTKGRDQLTDEITDLVSKDSIGNQMGMAKMDIGTRVDKSIKEAGDKLRDGLKRFGESAVADLQAFTDTLEGEDLDIKELFGEEVTKNLEEVEGLLKEINDQIEDIPEQPKKPQFVMFKEFGEKFKNTITSLRDGMVGIFTDALVEAKKLSDVVKSLNKLLLQTVIQASMQRLVGGTFESMFGIPRPSLATGGIVGQTASRIRVPPLAFAGAPSFQSGYDPNAIPAILHRGERVIPADSEPSVTINMSSPDVPLQAEVTGVRQAMDNMVADVIVRLKRRRDPRMVGF